jgi:hypothetical protein
MTYINAFSLTQTVYRKLIKQNIEITEENIKRITLNLLQKIDFIKQKELL